MLVLQRITVQRDSTVFFAKSRSELIHNAAVHPHEVVLRVLGHLHKFQHCERIAVQGVQGHGGHHLDGGRRGERRPDRQVAPIVEIVTFHIPPPVRKFFEHSQRIVHPGVLTLSQLFASQRKTPRLTVRGEDTRKMVFPFRHRKPSAHIEGGGEDETAVIVGVVADKVHTPGGKENERPNRPLAIKVFFHYKYI